MATDPQIFLRLRMLKKFLDRSTELRNNLLCELINRASDPTIRRRRIRMLRQLSQYESQIIKKIETLQSNDPKEFLLTNFEKELPQVVQKDA